MLWVFTYVTSHILTLSETTPLIESQPRTKCQPVYFSKKAPHFSEVFKFLEAKLGTETEQPLREHNRSLEKEKVERNQFAWYEI